MYGGNGSSDCQSAVPKSSGLSTPDSTVRAISSSSGCCFARCTASNILLMIVPHLIFRPIVQRRMISRLQQRTRECESARELRALLTSEAVQKQDQWYATGGGAGCLLDRRLYSRAYEPV